MEPAGTIGDVLPGEVAQANPQRQLRIRMARVVMRRAIEAKGLARSLRAHLIADLEITDYLSLPGRL
jgi:hypothetical protein